LVKDTAQWRRYSGHPVKAAPVLKELGQSSEMIPEGLNDATPEERHQIYKMLNFEVPRCGVDNPRK
jgi:hypothetical protein